MPDWLKTMPSEAHSALLGQDVRTVKQCPPFLDAMGGGWMMPLLLPQLEFTREASRSLDGLSLSDASAPFLLPSALWDGAARDLGDLFVALSLELT